MAQTVPPSITAVPTPAPQRNDRTTFSSRVDAFVTWLTTAVTQFGNVATNVYNNAVDAYNNATAAAASASTASTNATTATTQATNASTSASNASTSATNAAASAAVAASVTAFTDSNPVVKGSADATKLVRFEVDGLTTGTTRVITVPDADMTLVGTGVVNTFTAAQIFSDQQVSRAMLKDCGYTFLDKGNSSTTTQTFDFTAGSHQKVTATGNHTIATSNWPPTGNLGELLMEYVNGGAFTLTFPTISWLKPDGTTTTSISTYLAANTGRTALQSSGTDFILLWSRDAGTTIFGKLC